MKQKRPKATPKDDAMEKLMKLTKTIKMENIKVAPKGPVRGGSKWRQVEPKFNARQDKPADSQLVEAGGMQVDPSRQEEYENWRKDKIEEQNERRLMNQRRAEAKRKELQAELEARKNSPY
jgi:hypothetical protein